MGFRMNIGLPGPFRYSVGAPKVGRVVRSAGKAGKAIAKDARQCHEARDARPASQPRTMQRQEPTWSSPAEPDWALGILIVAGLLALIVGIPLLLSWIAG